LNKPDQPPSERSIWAIKPWWCQPWSIVLTGLLVVGSSWWLFQRWWLSTVLGTGVLLWWWLFLVVVPAAYRNGNLDS
jgi:membrane protein YdbS with pleckstrin-like domain